MYGADVVKVSLVKLCVWSATHVYINMGEQDAILCPYCATRFRFDPRLGPSEADTPDSLFVDPDLE